MNSNQTNTLVVKHYDNTYQICVTLGAYVRANAPDMKARDKACRVVSSHSDMQYPRDMLYSLGCVFNELSARSWDVAVEGTTAGAYVKHHARSVFYRRIANWANACYELVKEAPVIKPSPKADPMAHALTLLKDRLTVADFSKRRIDVAAALFKSVVLERPVGATVLDILERFGDEARELSGSYRGEYEAARFWDACVKISDDLRGNLVADQINRASTITVPEPDAVLWEVTGDPDGALYRTEQEAMRAARKLFPDESMSRRDLRLRSRNVKTFK